MKKVSFPLCTLSGAVGKKIVIKQYCTGTVVTRYPDMTKIIASREQLNCRSLFKKAVVFARFIISDTEKKSEYQQKIPKGRKVYNEAIAEYIKGAKET